VSTAIEWTDDTWNPVTGCSKVSPGCAHCYAEGVADRFWATQYRPVLADSGKSIDTISTSHHEDYLANGFARPRQFTDVQCHEDRLAQPLSWRKPRRVFVNSMSDLFHEDVPDAFIDRVFAVMALAPQHTFQILTKRAERMREYFGAMTFGQSVISEPSAYKRIVAAMDMPSWLPAGRRFLRVPENWPLPNVWLGVSVENQRFADERIPLLLRTPAAVRFISAEPLLGPVRLRTRWRKNPSCTFCDDAGNYMGTESLCPCGRQWIGLDWVIVGGESGPGARPFDLAWGRSIVEQCKAAGVPVFVKQLGAWPHVDWPVGVPFPPLQVSTRAAGIDARAAGREVASCAR